MKIVQICQAEPLSETVPNVTPVIIEISCSMLNGDTELNKDSSLEDHARVFEREAVQLEEALINALPGGTYSMLLSKMLERRASHFVVSFGGK